MAKAHKKDVIRVVTRSLPVKLKDEELRKVSRDLAEAVQDVAAEERRQTDLKAQMKQRLAELAAKKTRLALVVARGEEYRDVEIELIVTDGGQVEEVRTDTREIVIRRPLLDEERQRRLGS